MTTFSHEKIPNNITSTGPHLFKLFGKQGSFSILSKMGWITSKRRRTTGKQLLSLLTCCTITKNHDQSPNRHQAHSQPTTQPQHSSNPTPSQTATSSTTSLSLKEGGICDTSQRPCDGDKAKMIDYVQPTSLTDNIEQQQIDDNSNIVTSQQIMGVASKFSHRNPEMLDQKGITHMNQGDDIQENIAPSLDGEEDLWLLAPISEQNKHRKCLVLDLDETLVHSSFKATSHADFAVPVEIDGSYHNVYVLKRPGVDAFMKRMGELYEIVVFTASLSKYADPVLDTFDIHHVVQHRLFRESCFHHQGTYVKDLSQLGRELSQVIILDNSPASYIFHKTSAIPVSSWFNDPHDSELVDLIPFLEDLVAVDDVTDVLDSALLSPVSHF